MSNDVILYCATDYQDASSKAVVDYYKGLAARVGDVRALNREIKQLDEKLEPERKKLEKELKKELVKCQRKLDPAACERDAREVCEQKLEELEQPLAALRKTRSDLVNEVSAAGGTLQSGYDGAIRRAVTSHASCVKDRTGSSHLPSIRVLGQPTEVLPDIAYVPPRKPGESANERRYREGAEAFHKEWDVELRGPVTSLLDLLQDLASLRPSASRSDPLQRVRLVLHGNASGIWFPIVPGSDENLTEAGVDAVREGTVSALKYLMGQEERVTEQSHLRDILPLLDKDADYYSDLGLRNPSATLTKFIVWSVYRERHRAHLTKLSDFLSGRSRVAKEFDAAVGSSLDLIVSTLREEAKAERAGEGSLKELERVLKTPIDSATRDLRLNFTWVEQGSDAKQRPVSQLITDMKAGVKALQRKPGGKGVSLERLIKDATAQIDREAHIDLRACTIADKDVGILSALADLFRVPPDHVTGPEWFQWFGPIHSRRISGTCEQGFEDAAEDPDVGPWLARWAEELGIDKVALRVDWSEPRADRWRDMHPRYRLGELFKFTRTLPTLSVVGDDDPGWAATIYLDYEREHDCAEPDLTGAMEEWLRSLWINPPATIIARLVKEWKQALRGRGLPELVRHSALHGVALTQTAAGGGLDRAAFPANVEFHAKIVRGKSR